MLAIKNAKVILEDGIIWDGVVLCDGDRIVSLGKKNGENYFCISYEL